MQKEALARILSILPQKPDEICSVCAVERINHSVRGEAECSAELWRRLAEKNQQSRDEWKDAWFRQRNVIAKVGTELASACGEVDKLGGGPNFYAKVKT